MKTVTVLEKIDIRMRVGSELIHLFISFFRIGLFTFGGGYAMLSLLEDEVITKRNWITHDEMLDLYAIGQSTPGVIMVNTATFIGFNRAGYGGALIATLAVICPSIIIMTIVATLLEGFGESVYIQKALLGVNIAVAAMLCSALFRLGKQSVKSISSGIVMAVSFLMVQLFGISTIVIVPIAAILGVIFALKKSEKGE